MVNSFCQEYSGKENENFKNCKKLPEFKKAL